jgi:hypothetical protein
MPPRLPTVPAPVAALVAGCLGLALGRAQGGASAPAGAPAPGAASAGVLAPVGLQAYLGRVGGEPGGTTVATAPSEARWLAGVVITLGPWFVPRRPAGDVVVAHDRAGLAVVVPAPRVWAPADRLLLAARGELL